MKAEEDLDFSKQTKILSKHFDFLDHHYVRLLFEFCEFDAIRTYKVLEMIKDMLIPSAFIRKIVEAPNDSELLIKEKEQEYHKKYGDSKILLFQQNENNYSNQFNQINPADYLEFDFFDTLPNDVCIGIISYLNPFSLSKLVQTCSRFLKMSKSKGLHSYYQNLCIKTFKNEPTLPQTCRFKEIQEYILTHPHLYGPNIRNAATNNLRYLIWKSEQSSFKIDNTYYKSFGNYRNLFIEAPRINFNGYYVCKHKYVKIGEKGFTMTSTPIHVIYYYRYIRFFEDGTLLCCVSSTGKIKKEKLSKLLSKENASNFNPENTDELKIGEYMQHKNTLYVKIVRCNTVFNYEMQIKSNDGKISDELMVLSYTLEIVDEKEIIQNLYTYKPYKDKVLFHYFRNDLMEQENSSFVQSISF